MPTMSRLAAAICYGALAWVASGMYIDLMPERTQWGNFQPVNALIAMLVGWFVVGRRLRVDYVTAMGVGFTGMATAVFWCLFVQSFNQMINLALDRRYDGTVEAIVSVFKLIFDYAVVMANGPMIALLVIGGMLAGVIAEYVDRRWS